MANSTFEKNVSLCHNGNLENLRVLANHSTTDIRELFFNINKNCLKYHEENEIFILDEL